MLPLLEARGLRMDYHQAGQTFTVLDAVDAEVHDHSFTAVVGPSGSGKSTLLYVLSGLREPTAGQVSFRGADYRALGRSAQAELRRQQFGFVFQTHFLVNYLGALENVVVGGQGDRLETEERGARILAQLGLGDKLKRRPFELSVGERQRVAIARAMVGQPAVIFADEPTASLDHRAGEQVIQVLAEYRQHGAVVMVTHDLTMTRSCDRVLTMRDGRMLRRRAAGARPQSASPPLAIR